MIRLLRLNRTLQADHRSQRDSAKELATIVNVLDIATDENTRTPTMIDEVDKRLRRLGGEANALGAVWKDNPERIS